jgi:hypothetical protein
LCNGVLKLWWCRIFFGGGILKLWWLDKKELSGGLVASDMDMDMKRSSGECAAHAEHALQQGTRMHGTARGSLAGIHAPIQEGKKKLLSL